MKVLSELDLSTKKYIIFDMDGTLVDSIGVWNNTDYKIIKMLGKKEVDLTTIQKERDSFLENNQGADIYLEYCNYLIEKYNMGITKEELLALRWQISGEVLENDIDFKPFAVEVIKKLKSLGYVLVLATATTLTQIDIYSNKNIKMKEQMNIREWFDLIITKEDVEKKKPNPEIYLWVLRYYNAIPEECLVFEDSMHGIEAAKGANMETINVYDMYADLDRQAINELTDYAIIGYEEFLEQVLSRLESPKR